MRSIYTAAPLLLAGCVGSDYRVMPDPGFSTEVVDAARAAAADWEANVPVKLDVIDSPCPRVRQTGMICLHPVQSVPPVPWQPGHLVGYTVYSEIWLATPDLQAYDAAHRQRVIAHELGHAMGLQHTGPGTLMYPAANGGAMTVQPTDAAQWRTVHAALGK